MYISKVLPRFVRALSLQATALSSVLWMTACCGKIPDPITLPTPSTLPKNVYFRTRTQTFNKNYYFALHDGRIWVKENEEETKKKSDWRLLGNTGLPEGCNLKRFGVPKRLISISADGIHLQALSSDGNYYRGDNIRKDLETSFAWHDKWGWPMADGPGLRADFGTGVRWDVSDAHTFDLKHYEDGNGRQHSIGFGVAHIYMLDPGGKKIYYNDWWLPADWSRQICGPHRGTFQIKNLSVSGSTLFIIGTKGKMYTRMYDFDISGENPLLTYTFVQKNPPSHVRKIPMPGWHLQPPIPGGKVTSTITIFQTGSGNAARTLRVEGQKDGQNGFFYKAINATTWSFQETGQALQTALLQTAQASPEPSNPKNPEDRRYTGTLKREGIATPLQVELVNFHMVCSPAQLRILIDGKPVTAGGKELRLTFHHVHTMVTNIRPREYWKQGQKAKIRAAIVIPDSLDIDDAKHKTLLAKFFKGVKFAINFHGSASAQAFSLKELTIWDLFRVHDNEKGFTSRFKLSLQAP